MSELPIILQAALAPGYTLERELTGGGMSRVFVASDVALGRKVVVKVLPPELSAGVNHERFRREIQVAAQLQHPHVVPLLSAGEQGSLIWYTMPFIAGHSLREGLARGDKYAVKDVVRILRDVAEALDYAHGLGVIHRDIKPGNVLLLGSHALVTDFGVAKAISAAMPTSGYTSAGMAIGTPAYMAPEQIAADPAADHRMDLYALGLLGYEMLTGQGPFKEDSPQKTMAAQLTREPSPVENSRADVPPMLSALIRKLLSKIPDDRPQLASEVVVALDDIALSSGGSLAPLRQLSRPSRMRSVALVAAGVAIVALTWTLGERAGTVVGTTFVRDSVAAADSSALASAAAMLTSEDSMAIAKAVSARIAQRPAPVRVASAPRSVTNDSMAFVQMADSIRQQIQRAVLDSLVHLGTRLGPAMQFVSEVAQVATATAPAAPARPLSREPRRVVVALPRPARGRPDLDALALTIADSLRIGIDKHPRYIVVPADSVASALALSRTVNGIQERLDADIIVSINLIQAKDSVVRMISMRDLTAPNGFNYRVVANTVGGADLSVGLTEMVPKALSELAAMERSGIRSRTNPPTGVRPPRPQGAAPRAVPPARNR